MTDQLKLRDGDQPLPIINGSTDIQTMVVADIADRRQVGISRYGTALQPHNGRDALRDLYEELLDGVMYVKQVMVERGGAPTKEDIMAALNNEGAYCGDCDFESGLGCSDCSRVLSGYADAILRLFGGGAA